MWFLCVWPFVIFSPVNGCSSTHNLKTSERLIVREIPITRMNEGSVDSSWSCDVQTRIWRNLCVNILHTTDWHSPASILIRRSYENGDMSVLHHRAKFMTEYGTFIGSRKCSRCVTTRVPKESSSLQINPLCMYSESVVVHFASFVLLLFSLPLLSPSLSQPLTTTNTDRFCRLTDRYCLLTHFSDRKSTRLNSSHVRTSRMPSSAWKKKNLIYSFLLSQ